MQKNESCPVFFSSRCLAVLERLLYRIVKATQRARKDWPIAALADLCGRLAKRRVHAYALIAVTAMLALSGIAGCQQEDHGAVPRGASVPAPAIVYFNSNLPLAVDGYLNNSPDYTYGRTPSATAIKIPAGSQWLVQAAEPIRMDDLVSELRTQKIHGLLWNGENVKGGDLARLRDEPDLQVLVLRGRLTNGEMAQMASLTQLQWLDLSSTNMTDEWCVFLKGFKNLRVLFLDDTAVSDAGLARLETLSELETLHLSGTRITDLGVSHLSGLPKLRTLILADTQVTGTGLTDLRSLEDLTLRDPGTYGSAPVVTDAGMASLDGMSHLSHLDIYASKITDEGLFRLRNLKSLRSLELTVPTPSGCTSMGLAPISQMRSLEHLSLQGNAWVNDTVLFHVRGLRALRLLDLGHTRITDAGLVYLDKATTLEFLTLTGDAATDRGLRGLKGLTGLKQLDLAGTHITDTGLASIEAMVNIQLLDLSGTAITDAGLRHLEGLRDLQELWLGACPGITDAGLEHLKGLRSLTELFVSGTSITDTGKVYLKKVNPSVYVSFE
jgi:Leucine-rich repeat (LRR) protein